MQMKDRIAFVTGAGRGIGRAVCREMLKRGAAGVVIADLDGDMAQATAAELGGLGLQCDVSSESAVQAAVAAAIAHYGRVDVLLSNAGFGATELDLDDALAEPNDVWARMWQVHVMSHVYASRAVLPGNATTAADEADVRLIASITDVRNASGLTDYTGELEAREEVSVFLNEGLTKSDVASVASALWRPSRKPSGSSRTSTSG